MKLWRSLIVAAAFSALPLASYGAIAITNNSGAVQSGDRSGTDTCTVELTGVGSGESVVIGAAWRNADTATISGVDIEGQAASSQSQQSNAATDVKHQFWTLASTSSSGDKTVTVTWTAAGLGVCYAASLSGTDTGDLVDTLVSVTGSTDPITGSITTGAANNAIFVLASSVTIIDAPGANYTNISLINFWLYEEGEYDLDAGAAGSKTVDMSLVEDQQWAFQALSLNAAGGGGGSPPVLSSPTPSGTIATSTTATIGATTDTTSGTFYAVVDNGAGIAGITAAQIKAGQDSGSVAAIAACNGAVSTTSPSCGVTGLTASTAYSYAAVHNTTDGDSNVVTGTFTTAAPTSSLLLRRRK